MIVKRSAKIPALVFALLSFVPALSFAATEIGSTEVVVNVVEGTLDFKTQSLEQNDTVFQNEVILTASKSATEIVFSDETKIKLGPESEITLDEFVHDPDPTRSKMIVSFATGVFRFVSGKLDRSAYQILTPTATMGIRGTSFDMIVEEDGKTIVAVEEGEVEVANLIGEAIIIPAGLSSSVSPAPIGMPQSPPSALAPPSDEFKERFTEMDELFEGFLGSANTAFARFLKHLDWPRVLAWSAVVIFLIPLLTIGLTTLSIASVVAAGAILLWLFLG